MYKQCRTEQSSNRQRILEQGLLDAMIQQHYDSISVSDLCSLCLMSESQLRRLFRQNTGLSPGEYKNEFRVKRACAMLMSGNLAIAEISDVLGFDNVYYFSKVFKKIMGVSPGSFRDKNV